MKDIKKYFLENICIHCINTNQIDCEDIREINDNDLIIFKCYNYGRKKNMNKFKKYIKYTYYDETGKYIAVVYKDKISNFILKELKEQFDEIQFE